MNFSNLKYVQTVEDIYRRKEIDIPKLYEVVAFRPVREFDIWLGPDLYTYCGDNNAVLTKGEPRLILREKPKPKPRKRLIYEEVFLPSEVNATNCFGLCYLDGNWYTKREEEFFD